MKTTIYSFIVLLLLSTQAAKAAKGSFDVSLTFNGSPRTVSCFVPVNYDSTKSYRLMVCLHGLGDNSVNYRNALITSLGWATTFPNTIFLCPDGGSDRNKDFYQPAGDEEIIEQTMNYGLQNYHIDSTQIILQGFSLGGRSALKYGLENPSTFKALVLNTPAIQGMEDLNNNPIASLMYKFENAVHLPIFITVGLDDFFYANNIKPLSVKLKKVDCPVQYIEVTGVGHTIPNSTYLAKANTFISKPFGASNDVEIFELEGNNNQCSQTPVFNCWLRNNGDSMVNKVSLKITVGSQTITQNWSGILLPNQHVSIPVSINLSAGGHFTFNVECQNNNDPVSTNNSFSKPIEVKSDKETGMVQQGFDDDFVGWNIQPSGHVFGWYKDEEAKKSGTASIGTFNSILLFYNKNSVESFTSPFINIASLPEKTLSFDVAFNYFKYTAPYFTTDTYFADTLEVLISFDCGNTYQSLYKKGGAELSSASAPILNALTLQDCMYNPNSNEWRREQIDLSSFASNTSAMLKFNCISGMGGVLNIDNIVAGSSTTGTKELASKTNCSIYPNPASDAVFVDFNEKGTVRIYDVNGRLVISDELLGMPGQFINTNQLSNGLYYIEITTKNETITKHILIQK